MSGLLRFLAWVAVLGGAALAIVYYTYADVWVIPTDDARQLVSLEPTLRGGETVVVVRHGLPSLGDVVRCTDPDEPRRWVVGRLVGVSGSELKLGEQSFSTPGSHPYSNTACDKRQMVNPATGEEVDLNCRNEEFAGREYQSLWHQSDAEPDAPSVVQVPTGRSFLLSDNRYLHLDSRDYGPLPTASCHRILLRLWGADGFTDASRRFDIIW